MVRLLRTFPITNRLTPLRFNPTMVRLLLDAFLVFGATKVSFNPTMVRLLQGKIWGFGGRMRRNEGRVAVDLRLPEEPKGVDGK